MSNLDMVGTDHVSAQLPWDTPPSLVQQLAFWQLHPLWPSWLTIAMNHYPPISPTVATCLQSITFLSMTFTDGKAFLNTGRSGLCPSAMLWQRMLPDQYLGPSQTIQFQVPHPVIHIPSVQIPRSSELSCSSLLLGYLQPSLSAMKIRISDVFNATPAPSFPHSTLGSKVCAT